MFYCFRFYLSEDGIEEMVDDLNDGKILYAGLRVIDPNTNLPKIVFINWVNALRFFFLQYIGIASICHCFFFAILFFY